MKGKIIRSTGSWYDILGEDKKRYSARLRGKFKQDDLKVTNPIAVGDNVIFEDKGDNNFVITEIEDRENYIIRKSTHKASHAHLIASNIDQAILVATISRPRTSLGFIDRFLVSAEAFRIPSVIIFNKNDILDPEDKELEEAIMYMYREIGYECFSVSAALGKGIDELRDKLSGKISLISGHSGVGKSTLLNKIDPSLELKTGEISDFSQKGTHTTTFAEMFILNEDTFIIDTPGIKELGMIDMQKEEISHYFPEMREELGNCRFNNCLHLNEPGCAVRKKLTSGEISESRYASYLSMLEEKDSYR
jgi:ribosome biogenesis GTPase / thiamine phosphate phosphatase